MERSACGVVAHTALASQVRHRHPARSLRLCRTGLATQVHRYAPPTKYNKRAQRALGRSPEEKVKGHSGAIYRVPLIMLYTKYESYGPTSFRQEYF